MADQKRLQDLLAYPREDLSKEYKGWLDLSLENDKANLAKALLAIANHGGGYVILGFTESQTHQPEPQCPRPEDLTGYTQDLINNIVKRYAEPRFQCELHHISHPDTKEIFPIIKVPGGHRVPIRCRSEDAKKNIHVDTYYIQRPGPESNSPQTASEWDEFIGRCVTNARENLLEKIKSIVQGFPSPPIASDEARAETNLSTWIANSRKRLEERLRNELAREQPSRYAKGVWTGCYSIIGDFSHPKLSTLRDLLQRVEGQETGWPVWWVPL